MQLADLLICKAIEKITKNRNFNIGTDFFCAENEKSPRLQPRKLATPQEVFR